MNTLKYIAGVIIAMPMLSACSESFFDVTNPTAEPIEEYFTTDEHIQEAVIASYDPLQWPDWFGGQYNPSNIMSDIMADDIWVGGADRTDNAYWHLMMNYEALPNNCMSGIWSVAYSGIKRCNDVLQYIDWAGDKITEQNKKYYSAQALVLKAFYWNWLWKFWGNIPYYDENLTAPFIAEQLPADEVYAKVISTLETAIALDVLPMKEQASNYGRVTKAFAYMLYAEMVMYQNDETRFATALDYMKEIIESQQYRLNPDYAAMWLESGEWCDESIFEINYRCTNAQRSWSWVNGSGGTVLPRLISPNNWPDGTDGHDNGWGFAPVRQETYDMYAEGDVRRDATCWNARAIADYNPRYQDTGLFLGKYVARSGYNDAPQDVDLNFCNNLRVYRYAETLLNAAELIARGAGSGDAAGYLKLVHNRAGLADSPAATIDNILEERHLEFVGEGKRYWDLVRSDKAASTLVPDQYGYRTNSWSPNKKYLPIPQSEIDAAQGTLTQNNY